MEEDMQNNTVVILVLAIVTNALFGSVWYHAVKGCGSSWFLSFVGGSLLAVGLLRGVATGHFAQTMHVNTWWPLAAIAVLAPPFYLVLSKALTQYSFSAAYPMLAAGTAACAVLIDVATPGGSALTWRKGFGIALAILSVWVIKGGKS